MYSHALSHKHTKTPRALPTRSPWPARAPAQPWRRAPPSYPHSFPEAEEARFSVKLCPICSFTKHLRVKPNMKPGRLVSCTEPGKHGPCCCQSKARSPLLGNQPAPGPTTGQGLPLTISHSPRSTVRRGRAGGVLCTAARGSAFVPAREREEQSRGRRAGGDIGAAFQFLKSERFSQEGATI